MSLPTKILVSFLQQGYSLRMENLQTGQTTTEHAIAATKSNRLFDEKGRLIPPPGARVYSQKPRGYFTLVQPKIDLGEIHARIQKHLGREDLVTRQDFEKRAQGILENLKKNELTRDLLNAVHVPFFTTPEHQDMDMGLELEKTYLGGVKRSYEEMHPEYTFSNYFAGKLEGQVSVVPGCRYDQFIAARKKGPVVGWYFPNCLEGYALPDQRELIAKLPEGLILSGGIDAAAAFIGTPGIIYKKEDGLYPHLLALSAIQPKVENYFYHFEAYGWNLEFNCRSYLGAVSEYWAGGLTVIAA